MVQINQKTTLKDPVWTKLAWRGVLSGYQLVLHSTAGAQSDEIHVRFVPRCYIAVKPDSSD